MKRFSNQQLLSEIKNGNEEVLVYLSRKYFPASRRLLRLRGFPDEQTPEIFSDVLATVFMQLRREDHGFTDVELFFMNSLNGEIRKRRNAAEETAPDPAGSQPETVAARCVSILDEQAQKLLFARIAEHQNYESIAGKFNFSNAVIAQYEVNKCYSQLEGIVKLRLNVSPN